MLMTLRMRLPVWPFHSPLRNPVAEVGHLVEHGVDLRHDVLAVDDDRRALRGAQGHVQHGAVFGDVDLVAAEHGVDARAQAGLLGQSKQEPERFVGDAVLGVIQVEADGLDRQPLAAFGSSAKSLRSDSSLTVGIVLFQRFPGGACRNGVVLMVASPVNLADSAFTRRERKRAGFGVTAHLRSRRVNHEPLQRIR